MSTPPQLPAPPTSSELEPRSSELARRSVEVGAALEVPDDKSTGLAYLFAALGWLTPVAGIHRFYLNRPVSGVLFLLTWGCLGIGTLIDMFRIPSMVETENDKHRPPPIALGPGDTRRLSGEQQVLRIGAMFDGAVTVPMVALHSTMTLDEAAKELERMRKRGHCHIDVNEEGAKVYIFAGLFDNEPWDPE